jgi:hypothetical protein
MRTSGDPSVRRPIGISLPGGNHLNEVFIKIDGNTHFLRRAVNQAGNVLDI